MSEVLATAEFAEEAAALAASAEYATEEERWEALHGEGVEAAAPDDFAPDEGEDAFEEVGV